MYVIRSRPDLNRGCYAPTVKSSFSARSTQIKTSVLVRGYLAGSQTAPSVSYVRHINHWSILGVLTWSGGLANQRLSIPKWHSTPTMHSIGFVAWFVDDLRRESPRIDAYPEGGRRGGGMPHRAMLWTAVSPCEGSVTRTRHLGRRSREADSARHTPESPLPLPPSLSLCRSDYRRPHSLLCRTQTSLLVPLWLRLAVDAVTLVFTFKTSTRSPLRLPSQKMSSGTTRIKMTHAPAGSRAWRTSLPHSQSNLHLSLRRCRHGTSQTMISVLQSLVHLPVLSPNAR